MEDAQTAEISIVAGGAAIDWGKITLLGEA
jgi:hypothetical protein